MRLYNASEQSFQNLAPKKIYTLPPSTTVVPPKTAPKEISEKVVYYVAENKKSVGSIIKDVSSKKIEESVQTISQPSPKQQEVKSIIDKTSKPITSPVEISVTPEENTAPK